ncbi:hypothetical protein DPMN_074034 [Dreissena polymorpha]|uniref:Uncharacterized protein n=1 Tax=Dreissena polymorpha TaxID=45954 RepID=A0A9D3YHL7_DREPO|nr:hypothetical protein DPMN_074034 [Dreissena polymorpha]
MFTGLYMNLSKYVMITTIHQLQPQNHLNNNHPRNPIRTYNIRSSLERFTHQTLFVTAPQKNTIRLPQSKNFYHHPTITATQLSYSLNPSDLKNRVTYNLPSTNHHHHNLKSTTNYHPATPTHKP